MSQVAGVLVGDGQRQFAQLGVQLDGGEKLIHVLDEGREFARTGGVGRVVFEQLAIFFERRAASGSVSNDGVVAGIEQPIDIAARQRTGLVADPGVNVESAATRLTARNRNFAAVFEEYSDGCFVETREADVGDAAPEKSDAVTRLAFGSEGFAVEAEEERRLGVWGDRIELSKAAAQQPDCACEFADAEFAVEVHPSAGEPQRHARWEEAMEDKVTQHPRSQRTMDRAFDFRSGCFD